MAAEGRRRLADQAGIQIEVVRDPTGCNLDPTYGLHSANPMISVFRRPRVAANLRYVVNEIGDQPRPQGGFNIKTGMPLAVDPDTGLSVTMQLMADSREPTLRAQAVDTALSHEQAAQKPTKAQLDQIVDFESPSTRPRRSAGRLGTCRRRVGRRAGSESHGHGQGRTVRRLLDAPVSRHSRPGNPRPAGLRTRPPSSRRRSLAAPRST